MQYGEIVSKVNDELGLEDKERAGAIVTDTLDLLGRRLAGGEPTDLASQLPSELQDVLNRHDGEAETYDVDEFLRRLADRDSQGTDPEQAREHARTVLRTLGTFVSEGELTDVREQLPAGYQLLFA